MMRLLLAAIVASTVSAFVSQATSKASSLAAVAPEKEIGVQAPIGFFDPLGFLNNGPYGDRVENFRHYRSVEVKHGRIAMAATLGMLVQENYRFAGDLSPSEGLKFEDVPNGLAALDVVPLAGWVQMAVVIGLHEVFIKERPNKAPGNFGTGYFGVALDDQSAKQLRALNVEVANGRLAMLGILGMFASESIHGEALWETQILG
ncbi:hypothetical protein MPSEU_000268700 [Mayamaea pseudoterrestris]|nr:hypothetical protein MPSEU_000268700 [Mayamaea pseudoterrestris]